jgi:hypothetical protein
LGRIHLCRRRHLTHRGLHIIINCVFYGLSVRAVRLHALALWGVLNGLILHVILGLGLSIVRMSIALVGMIWMVNIGVSLTGLNCYVLSVGLLSVCFLLPIAKLRLL